MRKTKDLVLNLVERDGDRLFTTSLLVAEKFKKMHKDVLRAIREKGVDNEFRRRNFARGSYIDAQNQSRPIVEMTKKGFMILAMGFTGKDAIDWQIKFIDAFEFMEKELQRLYAMRQSPDWKTIRRDTKEAFKLVALVLQETRKLQSKETEPHHYMNEARLMNGVLTGTYQGLSRDDMSDVQLKTLDAIQQENSRMLIQGMSYKDRKQALLNLFIPKLPQH